MPGGTTVAIALWADQSLCGFTLRLGIDPMADSSDAVASLLLTLPDLLSNADVVGRALVDASVFHFLLSRSRTLTNGIASNHVRSRSLSCTM